MTAADQVTIRPEAPGDHAAIADVVSAAFGSDREAQLVAAIRASPAFVPELALVAVLDGAVVGHVVVSYVGLADGDGRLRQIASLSPLAVAPEHQRQGIGSALVRAVVAEADRRGELLVVLEGDPGYYGRLGFEHSVPHGITITLPSWAPPEAAQILRLRRYDPALAGHVVYPPAFDRVIED